MNKTSTAGLIRENKRYIKQTGYDRPWIVAELRERARNGDFNAMRYLFPCPFATGL